jgi:hypothetical protein
VGAWFISDGCVAPTALGGFFGEVTQPFRAGLDRAAPAALDCAGRMVCAGRQDEGTSGAKASRHVDSLMSRLKP